MEEEQQTHKILEKPLPQILDEMEASQRAATEAAARADAAASAAVEAALGPIRQNLDRDKERLDGHDTELDELRARIRAMQNKWIAAVNAFNAELEGFDKI